MATNQNWLGWFGSWLLLAILFMVALKPPISKAYVDFGDGNYQYISWRIGQDLTLYKDILSPQPPFHLWLGALIGKAAQGISVEPLYLFRWSTVVIRLLSSLLVSALILQLFQRRDMAILGAFVFLILPEGYRWGQGYQSENLQILLLTFSLWAWLQDKVSLHCLSTISAICAIWTNMSSLPFSVVLLMLVIIHSPRWWIPLLTASLSLIFLLGTCLLLYGNSYFENVWHNQIASFPDDISTALKRIYLEGGTILQLEGFYILAALMGMVWFLRTDLSPTISHGKKLGLSLYGIMAIGSAIYVIKGGTVDYIFCLAGPMIAVFSPAGFYSGFGLFPSLSNPRTEEGVLLRRCRQGLFLVIACGVIAILLWQPLSFIQNLHHQSTRGVDLPDRSEGRIVEYSDAEVQMILRIIDQYTDENQVIWAPPFLAVLSHHPIAMDLSETYLWYVRWARSLEAEAQDPGVDKMIQGMTQMLSRQEIPILLLNSRKGQWGFLMIPDLTLAEGVKTRNVDQRIDALQSQLEQNYHPLRVSPETNQKIYLQGWNERLEIWIPNNQNPFLPANLIIPSSL